MVRGASLYAALTLCFCAATGVSGAMGPATGNETPTAPTAVSAYRSPLLSADRFSFLIGAEWLFQGSEHILSPALALRYRLWSKPGALSPSALEIGGALPTSAGGNFRRDDFSWGGVAFASNVESFSEAHLAAVWPFAKGERMIPELAVGFSVAPIKNRATASPSTAGYPYEETHLAVSPYLALGATFPIRERFSLHAAAGYRLYTNPLVSPGNQNFDLNVSGLSLRTAAQWTF